MEPVNVAIGCAAIAFGCVTFYVRATDPARLGKLTAMREQFGERPGVIMHTVAYSIIPIGSGIIVLALGLDGRSIFG